MVINGTIGDREPVIVDMIVVNHCDKDIYLGSPFTSDGSLSSVVKAHVVEKMAHFHKFIAFIDKNSDLPFVIKMRVFDACFLSAILYGCESWLSGDLKPVCKIYNWALKQMLGVRLTTCNDICYIESGCAPLKAIVKSKQRIFFARMFNERQHIQDDPFSMVLTLVLGSRYNTKTYLQNLIDNDNFNDYQCEFEILKAQLRGSSSSRKSTYYNMMNKNLMVHDIYSKRHNIFESHRVAFTRFCVSSQGLFTQLGLHSY